MDHIKGSRLHNLKELRTGTIRVLFVFERGGPLMLVGGDKRGRLERLVPAMTSEADRLYRQVPTRQRKGGTRMAPRSAKSWKVVRQELPIDEARVAAYARIIEAQNRIAASRTRAGRHRRRDRRGAGACEPPDPESLSPRDLYLAAIEAFVAALGGRLDGTSAIFGDERVDLPAAE